MEIKDTSAINLALTACTGIITLVAMSQDDPMAKENLQRSLNSVKEVLDFIEHQDRDKNADMVYAMLSDAYHQAFKAVYNNDFSRESIN